MCVLSVKHQWMLGYTHNELVSHCWCCCCYGRRMWRPFPKTITIRWCICSTSQLFAHFLCEKPQDLFLFVQIIREKKQKFTFKHQFYSIFLTSPHLSVDGVALPGLPRGLQNMPHKIRHFKHRVTSAAFEEQWPIYVCIIAISKCVQETWALNSSLSRLLSVPSLCARWVGAGICMQHQSAPPNYLQRTI